MLYKIRNDLHDAEILKLLEDDDGIYPIFYSYAEIIKKNYINYQIYDERVDFYAGNEDKSTIFYVQIDIFSCDECVESLGEVIKKVLREKGYRLINIFGRYEKDTKLYHKILRFNFSKLQED